MIDRLRTFAWVSSISGPKPQIPFNDPRVDYFNLVAKGRFMTDIAQEINSRKRTPAYRPSRAKHPSEWKVTKRYRLGSALLGLICRENGISADDLRSRSQATKIVALRRRFARICRSNKVGRTVVAKLLQRDESTIAAYLSDKLVQSKVERRRRDRATQRNSIATS